MWQWDIGWQRNVWGHHCFLKIQSYHKNSHKFGWKLNFWSYLVEQCIIYMSITLIVWREAHHINRGTRKVLTKCKHSPQTCCQNVFYHQKSWLDVCFSTNNGNPNANAKDDSQERHNEERQTSREIISKLIKDMEGGRSGGKRWIYGPILHEEKRQTMRRLILKSANKTVWSY